MHSPGFNPGKIKSSCEQFLLESIERMDSKNYELKKLFWNEFDERERERERVKEAAINILTRGCLPRFIYHIRWAVG